jgi:hypothetical protein
MLLTAEELIETNSGPKRRKSAKRPSEAEVKKKFDWDLVKDSNLAAADDTDDKSDALRKAEIELPVESNTAAKSPMVLNTPKIEAALLEVEAASETILPAANTADIAAETAVLSETPTFPAPLIEDDADTEENVEADTDLPNNSSLSTPPETEAEMDEAQVAPNFDNVDSPDSAVC